MTATIISNLETGVYHGGITIAEDRIYLLQTWPEMISVLKDRDDFSLIQEITLNGTTYSNAIVYSNRSKSVYVNDPTCRCIWAITTTDEHRQTRWLADVPWITGLSLSNDGNLLVLRYRPSSQLEIYSLNSNLISRTQLSHDIQDPKHVVQTSTGEFILLHRLINENNGLWVISKLTNDGHLINRFIPRNQCEKFTGPSHLSLDSDNNRLFVADYFDDRVTLFDSIYLTWSQVLVSEETHGILSPYKLIYDASRKYLFVAQYTRNLTIFEIN